MNMPSPHAPARSAARPWRAALLACVLGCAAGLSGTAQAQWAWHESNGNTTFSDSPPPSDVNPAEIFRQPSVAPSSPRETGRSEGPGSYAQNLPANPSPSPSPAPSAAPANNAAAPGAKAPGGPKTLAEQEADFRKRAAEREKASQKQAEEDAKAEQRAAACTAARNSVQMIDSGTRLMRPDADGNRSFMDDEQRAAERQKAQEAVARNC